MAGILFLNKSLAHIVPRPYAIPCKLQTKESPQCRLCALGASFAVKDSVGQSPAPSQPQLLTTQL